jgi:hypothetical protein
MSRLKLICLLSFNAIAASIIVALVTILLASSEKGPSALQVACLEDNDTSATGAGQLTGDRGFETIGEAEAFICHRIAYPRDPKGWLIEDISAVRRAPPREIAQGNGFASVTLNYRLARGNTSLRDTDLRIEVSPFAIDPVTYGIVDRVKIMGAKADVIRGHDPNLVILQWRSSGYSFYTEARLSNDFSLNDLLTVLNTIE